MIYLGIGLGIVITLILIILILASMKPDQFRIERSRQIDAPPEVVFSIINDLNRWAAWSPWEKLDPNMKKTITGSGVGVGSKVAWEGNSKVGAGSMEVIESNPNSLVRMDLLFLRPFKCNNTAIFSIQPQDGKSRVIWAMEGKALFMSKVMQVVCNLDKMVGKDFEEGLNNLNKLASS